LGAAAEEQNGDRLELRWHGRVIIGNAEAQFVTVTGLRIVSAKRLGAGRTNLITNR
jgi:hypothetical protein